MHRQVASRFGAPRVVVALQTQRNTLPVAPWLIPPIVVSIGRKRIGGARRRACAPGVVLLLGMPRVLDRASGVWAAIAVMLGVSLRTVVGRGVRTMARLCRAGAIAIIAPAARCSAISGPIARIAQIVGRPSALAAAVDVQPHHRATTAGSCTPLAGAV
jgi:hypothetical protein